MKPVLLLLILAALASCSSSSGSATGSSISSIPGGIIGAVTGGLIGKLVDSNDTNNGNSSGGLFGGNGGTTVNSVGTTNVGSGSTVGNSSNGFFDRNRGLLTGAVGGFAGGAVTDAFRKGEIERKYDEGYSKGKSDSVKDLYFLKRDAQRPKEGQNDVHYRYYEVDVPAHTTSDGVLIDRHRQVIEVLE